jgi:hypothetical protein
VKRIGTSGAKAIANEGNTNMGYFYNKKQYEKSLFALVLSFFSFFSYSQDRDLESSISERFPVFPHCENRRVRNWKVVL